MGAAEITHHVFFGVAALLVSDDNAAGGIQGGESRRHRFVVGKLTISPKLGPAGETTVDIIEGEWPLDVTRNLNPLPGAEIAVNLATGIAQFGFDRLDLGIEIDI